VSKCKAKYLDSARRDINDAVSYIAENLNNPTAANALIAEIDNKITLLCSGHWRGQILQNHSSGLFIDIDMNWCKVKNCYLFFRFDEANKALRIYHFCHRLRGLERLLIEFDNP
jgi:plasmid stabilization system protein ParE